jgi:atypical dual specificity phosphatase
MLNFGHIESDIFVGCAPQSSVDVARLGQMRINAVLSLQSDDDFITHAIDWKKLQSAYQYNNIEIHRFAIRDFDEFDMSRRLEAPVMQLHNLLVAGRRIYVHCNAGVCRAPATVLAYLCHYRGMSIEHGLEYIRRNRPQANPYVDAVEKTLSALKNKTA